MAVLEVRRNGRTYFYSRQTTGKKYNPKTGKRESARTTIPIPAVDPDTNQQIDTALKRSQYDARLTQQIAAFKVIRSKRTVGDLCAEFERVVLGKPMRSGTRRGYATTLTRIRTMDNGVLISSQLDDISRYDIASWLAKLESAYSHGVCSNTLSMLRRIFAAGVEWEWMTTNPSSQSQTVRLSKVTASHRVKFLTQDDVHKLMDACETDTQRRLYAIAIAGGFRIGEMLAMRERNIDWERSRYSICPHTGSYSGSTDISGPKSECSVANVELGTPFGEILKSLRQQVAHVAALRLRMPDYPQTLTMRVEGRNGDDAPWEDIENDFLWVSERTGHPCCPQSVNRHLKKAIIKAGLDKKLSFHALRHTTATLMLAQGEGVKAVQRHMRHATASETLDTYGHFVDDAAGEAVNRLGQALGW